MTFAHGGRWLAIVGIVVGIAEMVPTAAARTPSVSPVLNLRLTVSNELAGVSRSALVKETESIWRDGYVQLRWLAGSASPESGMTLRVLVTPRAVTSTADGNQWAVGELLRFEGSGAIAVASITAAQRIVLESQPLRLLDLPAVQQHRLGVVLGRAVAHEIGHYVLGTNTHAPYGLMRASIDAREFADLRASTFRLDREAQAHLAARSTRPDVTDGTFSYPTP